MTRAVWVVVALLAVACGQGVRAPDAPLELERLLPTPELLNGWAVVEGPDEYVPATLFEVLDGGAERYLGYGFRRLLRVRCQRGGEAATTVTLDLFDMGGDLGAFGVYSGLRPAEAGFATWGAEGYRSGTVTAAWKGRLLVHGEADTPHEGSLALLERLVSAACERAPGSTSAPRILTALPREGLVARSERYVASDLLGHEFLPGGVQASYLVDGRRGELFWSRLPSRRAAARALGELRTNLERAGRVEPCPGGEWERALCFVEPSLGRGMALAGGRFVAGAHGELDPRARERLLRELVRGLERLEASE